jgi:hypothetical protein
MVYSYFTPVLQLYTNDPEVPGGNATSYLITEHNRQPLEISYETIEDSNRMADGTLRKFVTANKKRIAMTWQTVPAAGGKVFTADGNLGAAFLKSFYEEYVYKPVWVRMTYAAENWRFVNTLPDTSPSATTNSTYLYTNAISSSLSYTFSVTGASVSTFSNGSAVATLTTNTPHNLTTTNSPYILVSGIDQIYNGTWKIASTTSNTINFNFGANTNASADFNINSYVQSGSTATLNIDNTDFLTVSSSISIINTKSYSGNVSNINGTWVVTSKSGTNLVTASNSTFGSTTTSNGYSGTGIVIAGAGSSKTLTTLSPGLMGPAIASDTIKAFITNFTYNVTHRYALTDYVDMSIEFTEI